MTHLPLPRFRKVFLALIAIPTAALLIPASGAQAKIKPQDGIYYDATSKKAPQYGYVTTDKGKVTGAGFNLKFKDAKGKTCTPEGFIPQAGGWIEVSFETSKDRPNGRGKFSVKVKSNASFPGIKGRVSGKFKSKNRAVVRADLKAGGCSAKATYSKALYSAGG